jgi:hypothetical protein
VRIPGSSRGGEPGIVPGTRQVREWLAVGLRAACQVPASEAGMQRARQCRGRESRLEDGGPLAG